MDTSSFLLLAQEGVGETGGAEVGFALAGLLWLACMGVSALFGLASLGLWIWMIVDCTSNEPSEGNDKIVWLLVILLTGVIGAAIYYFVRRPKRMAELGR